MAGTTPVTIREEVVSSSKGLGHNWAPSTNEITPHQASSRIIDSNGCQLKSSHPLSFAFFFASNQCLDC